MWGSLTNAEAGAHRGCGVSAVPLTAETTDLYDTEFFAVLKPTAFFINIARGGSVDTDALVAALMKDASAGQGSMSPIRTAADGPSLWKAPRTLITPHIAGRSEFRMTRAGPSLRRTCGATSPAGRC